MKIERTGNAKTVPFEKLNRGDVFTVGAYTYIVTFSGDTCRLEDGDIQCISDLKEWTEQEEEDGYPVTPEPQAKLVL